MKKYPLIAMLLLLSVFGFGQQQQRIQLVYVSDSHYGLERDFRGKKKRSASEVNRVMIEKINALPDLLLPEDGGVQGGQKVAWVDYVVNTGDISSRAERDIQPSARSWEQFRSDWSRLSLRNAAGAPAPLLLAPGNHDISNAVGHHAISGQKVDATAAAEIYNAMLKPATPLTKHTYRRDKHLCSYAFSNSGVHFVLVDVWPDARNRAWLKIELQRIPKDGICLLFAHDQPDVEAKHLINPNGKHDVNSTDRFEGIVGDTSSVASSREQPVDEHRELDKFLGAHPVIKAYFHGNEHYSELYAWGESATPVFGVDSPMKGVLSSKDESLLSFLFVVIDTEQRRMTVRECLWNQPGAPLWGKTLTVDL